MNKLEHQGYQSKGKETELGLTKRSSSRSSRTKYAQSLNPWQKHEKLIQFILWAAIILYPLISAFFGLDLGDTGYHLYHYQHLFDEPSHLSFTAFFTLVLGHLWWKFFGEFGLIGFNILEVILELGIVTIVYRTFSPMLGRTTTLIGSLIAIMAAGTYLNIFNYHQFNAFLLVVIFALQYRAIMEERYSFSFCTGLTFACLVFSRLGSVTAVISILIYILDYFMSEGVTAKSVVKHIFAWFIGTVVGGAIFIVMLKAMGLWEAFVGNVFRLGDLATGDVDTSYNFMFLLRVLIFDNLKAMASGLLFLGAGIMVLIALSFILKHYQGDRRKKHFLWRMFGLLIGFFILAVALYQMTYAYDINPAENWIQMTTGPRFTIGVMYIFGFFAFAAHAARQTEESRRMRLFILSAYMIVVLTIAGSNTGTKHIVLGLWLMAPLFTYVMKQLFINERLQERMASLFTSWKLPATKLAIRLTAVLLVVMFGFKFMHMIYYTSNYDAIDRRRLVAEVDHPMLQHIYTTQEQKESMEAVLDALDEIDSQKTIKVFGASVLYYYLQDRPSYCRPWVTAPAFTVPEYERSLRDAKARYGNEGLPVVLYCRTHYADGFGGDDFIKAREKEKENSYGGKKEVFYRFLEYYNYGVVWEDPYHVILLPWSDMPFGEVWSTLEG